MALLENPIGTTAENYLTNGNRLLLDLFNTQIEMCDALTDPNAQLQELATRIEAQGFRPYVIPVGGSNATGALGYVEARWKLPSSVKGPLRFLPLWWHRAVRERTPGWPWAGTTDARRRAHRRDRLAQRRRSKAQSCNVAAGYCPRTGTDGLGGYPVMGRLFCAGLRYAKRRRHGGGKTAGALEGILLDPVYTGKAMAGLIDGISQKRFKDEGSILFIHTGGAPALFAYHPHV